MGLADMFNSDDRVDLKVNDLIGFFRSEARVRAENEVMINGLRARIPAAHILVIIGKLGTDCVEDKEI